MEPCPRLSFCVWLTGTFRAQSTTKMVSSWMLRRVALARTDVSEELSASIIRVSRIAELGTTLAATRNRRTPRRTTRCNIPEDTILHSHRRENLKSYRSTTVHIDWAAVVVCGVMMTSFLRSSPVRINRSDHYIVEKPYIYLLQARIGSCLRNKNRIRRIIIFLLILYGCESCYFDLWH
jgi:hypothetical protein